MSHPANPFFELGTRIYRGELDPNDLRSALQQLDFTELGDPNLFFNHALNAVFQPEVPPQLLASVVLVLQMVLELWDPMARLQLQQVVTRWLLENSDGPEGLLLAAQQAEHWCRVLQENWGGLGTSLYAEALRNASVAYARLAQYNVDPVENTQRALARIELARFSQGNVDGQKEKRAQLALQEVECRKLCAHYNVQPRENFDQALRLCLELREQFSPPAREYALATSEGADTLVRLARVDPEPQQRLLQAIRWFEEARPLLSEPGDLEECLLGEAAALIRFSDYVLPPRNREYLLAALARYRQYVEEARRTEGRQYGYALIQQANVHQRLAGLGMDDPREELRQARECAEAACAVLPPGSDEYYNALTECAAASMRAVEMGLEPQEMYREVIRLYQQIREGLVPTHRLYHSAAISEGTAWERLGDRDRSLRCYLDAAQATQENTVEWAQVQSGIGYLLFEKGEFGPAYDYLAKGVMVFDGIVEGLLSEQDRVAFREGVGGQYLKTVECCLKLDEQANSQEEQEKRRWDALGWAWRSKTRSLDLILPSGTEQLTDETKLLRRELARKERDLDSRWREVVTLKALLERASRRVQPSALERMRLEEIEAKEAAYEVLAEEFRSDRENLLLQIASQGQRRAATRITPPQTTVAGLRRLLEKSGRPGARPLLVEYLVLSPEVVVVFWLPLWQDVAPQWQQIRVTSREGEGEAALLQLAGTLFQSAEVLRGGARAGRSWLQMRDAARSRFHDLLSDLSQFLTPWASQLDVAEAERPTEILLSPHGLLSLLPLHAATWEGEPLIAHLPVSYLPAASLAEEMLDRRERIEKAVEVTGLGPALVVGEPQSDSEEINAAYLYLEHAEAEAEEVHAQLAQAVPVQPLCTGTAAGIESVLQQSARAAIFHYAAHTTLDEKDPLRTGLELADGRLSLLRLDLELQLHQAHLVYLSSCESAATALVGKSDSLIALARVFLRAGAPSVVASLWPVADEAAPYLAKQFYAAWLGGGVTLAEALQQAALAVRGMERFRDPFYWAPFVLLGAGGSQAPVPVIRS